MLLDPRTPLVIGSLLVLAVVGLLAYRSPAPGSLASAHGQIHGLSRLEGCVTCHDAAGLAQGCLNCHREIASQLAGGAGYHHHLLAGREIRCDRCHSEHAGKEFELINESSWGAQGRDAFAHPHVEFSLTGKHDRIECRECHAEKLPAPFNLPAYPFFPRRHTFLGLDQTCLSCHDDIHAAGLASDCESCHGQEAFRPTSGFDHGRWFQLAGGHERVPCSGCHAIPPPDSPRRPLPFPFEEVRGRECSDCHSSPHRAAFPGRCEACHAGAEPLWIAARGVMTPGHHALTGFHLMGGHAGVSCAGCHAPEKDYAGRHPDPAAPDYRRREHTCEGCHQDVHGGQFLGRHEHCGDCHQNHQFTPPRYGRDAHARLFPLAGAHAAVPCSSCHSVDSGTGVRKFAETPRRCTACHDNPHGDQFDRELAGADCNACHSTESFRIRPFDHEKRAGHPLLGAHARADCNGCHVEVARKDGGRVRRFRGTPKACASCHQDVHRGQFKERWPDCASCHVSFDSWRAIRFDHDAHSRFPLEGAHARAACSRCHLPARLPDGAQFVRYRPLEFQCGACHEVDSRLRMRKVR